MEDGALAVEVGEISEMPLVIVVDAVGVIVIVVVTG